MLTFDVNIVNETKTIWHKKNIHKSWHVNIISPKIRGLVNNAQGYLNRTMLREFSNISETLKTTIKFGLLFARRSNFLLVITLFSLFLSSILFYLGLILFGFLLQNMFASSSVKIIPAMSFLNEFTRITEGKTSFSISYKM